MCKAMAVVEQAAQHKQADTPLGKRLELTVVRTTNGFHTFCFDDDGGFVFGVRHGLTKVEAIEYVKAWTEKLS